MENLKFKQSALPGSFIATDELTEQDILDMALHLASKKLSARQKVDSPELIVDYLRCMYHNHHKEVFGAIFLDNTLSIIETKILFSGTVNHVPVIPREIIREALMHNASCVIVFHNHLTTNSTPSSGDRKTTTLLAEACAAVGLDLVDHLILTPTGHSSFAEMGLL